MYSLSLGVHQLVDFVLRKGDIDTRVYNQATMQEGTKLHAIYQKSQGDKYLSEVNLRHIFSYGDYEIELYGRCDGIRLEEVPIIEEIKTTNENLDKYHSKNKDWHLGQAICYAYIYGIQNNIDDIGISLIYISQIDGSKKIIKNYYKVTELLRFIHSYFNVYVDFNMLLNKRIKQRDESLKDLSFPFKNFREGQKEMVEEVVSSYKDKKVTFVEASTGIGKTMSTIFGSLEGLKSYQLNKVFYATPKNSGFVNSFNALNLLIEHGYSLNAVELIAKEKICPNHCDKNCNPDDCPLARGYYDKVNLVLKEILLKEKLITHNVVLNYALRENICPFELSLDLSLYTDFVVCDYNYIFHPIAALKRFFEDPPTNFRKLLLVDEAHNLVDRSRDMFSSEFNSYLFKSMKKVMMKSYKNESLLMKAIKKVTTLVNQFKNFVYPENESYVVLEILDHDFIDGLKTLDKRIKEFNERNPKVKIKELEDFSRMNYNFLKIYDEYFNIDYRIVFRKTDEDFVIKLFCINPSVYLLSRIHDFEGTTLFSATISPVEYYQDVLLGRGSFDYLSLKSPFDTNNLLVLADTKTSLKYKDRSRTFNDVIDEILTFVDSKVGNYIIFAPSFEYLNMIKSRTIKDDRFIYQEKSMSALDRELFLMNFEINPKSSTIAVCVMGGSFSEGIDLLGDRLIGVVVIGVGIPTISVENKLINDYYNAQGENGYAYAFANPGINKVMQAVGRLIRTETDKGVALLIDDRYRYSYYKQLFESKWPNNAKITSSKGIKEELIKFYDKI